MRADGLTKFYETKAKWDYAVFMLGMKFKKNEYILKAKSVQSKQKQTSTEAVHCVVHLNLKLFTIFAIREK